MSESDNVARFGIEFDPSGAVDGRNVAVKNFDDIAKAAQDSGDQTSSAWDNAWATIKAGAIALGAYDIVGMFKQWATGAVQLAARYQELGTGLDRVAANVGTGKAALDSYQAALMKTGISAISARQSLMSMVQAGIDLTQSTKLARIAQDAAVVAQLNSSDAFERLIYGVQTGNTMILRNLGIMVNMTQAYEKYALSIHKSVGNLTDEERQQARVNAIMQASVNITGLYEASMESAGKVLRSSERYMQNLQVAVGTAFQPMYAAAVFHYADGLQAMSEWATKNMALLQQLATFLVAGTIVASIVGIAAALERAGAAMLVVTAIEGWTLLGEVLDGVLSTIVGMNGALAMLTATVSTIAAGAAVPLLATFTAIALVVANIVADWNEVQAANKEAMEQAKTNDVVSKAHILHAHIATATQGMTPGSPEYVKASSDVQKQFRDFAQNPIDFRSPEQKKAETDAAIALTKAQDEETKKLMEQLDAEKQQIAIAKELDPLKKSMMQVDAEVAKMEESAKDKGTLTPETLRLMQQYAVVKKQVLQIDQTNKDTQSGIDAQVSMWDERIAWAHKYQTAWEAAQKSAGDADYALQRELNNTATDFNQQIFDWIARSPDAVRQIQEKMKEAKDKGMFLGTPEEQTAQAADFLNFITHEVVDPMYQKGVEIAQKSQDGWHAQMLKDGTAMANAASKPFETMVKDMQRSFESAFESIWTDGFDNAQKFVNSLKSLFTKLASDLASEGVIQPLVGKLFGTEDPKTHQLVGGLFSGAGSSTPLTADASPQDVLDAGSVSASASTVAGAAGFFISTMLAIGSSISETSVMNSEAAKAFAAATTSWQLSFNTLAKLPGSANPLNSSFQSSMDQAIQNAATAIRNSPAAKYGASGVGMFGATTGPIPLPGNIQGLDAYIANLIGMQGKGKNVNQDRDLATLLTQLQALDAEYKKQTQQAQDLEQQNLKVRLLRAEGQNQAADLMALQIQQTQEMKDAIAEGYDPTTIALLKQTQAQEMLAAATGQSTNAALNMVNGYKLQAAIFGAAAAHGIAGLAPTPSLGSVSPTGASGTNSGDLVIPVIMPDGTVLAKATLKGFKQMAARQYGDTTKWSAIQ